jgi:5-aminopentanamidase
VVLPELCLSGYAFRDREEAAEAAVGRDSAVLGGWGAVGPAVVGGFCELGEGGQLFNSAAVVDGSGVRAVYRKAHLWARESEVFAAGTEPPPVVELRLGRVAAMVCYDLFFPEWARLAALAGAELLCVPANWPAEPRPPGERPMQIARAMVAAEANGLFVATCDRCGAERGEEWMGASAIAGPDGWPLATAPGPVPTTVAADVDLEAARAAPPPGWRTDRRPELYGPLVAAGAEGRQAPQVAPAHRRASS